MTSKRIVWLAAFLLTTVAGCSQYEKNYIELDDEETTSASAVKDEAPILDVAPVAEKSSPAEATSRTKDREKSSAEPEFDAKGVSVDLTGVDFDGLPGVSSDGVDDPKVLEPWQKVKVVRGSGVITAKAWQTFERLPDLTEFLWQDARVSNESNDQSITVWANRPKLKKVRLTGLRFVDRDELPPFVFALYATPNLEDLDLSGSAITARDLEALDYKNGFKKLTRLNLYQTKVGDVGVKAVLPLKDQLTWLNVDDAGITPEAAQYLEQFTKLTFLHVGRSTLDDSCVDSLAKLTNLKKIHVTRCGITEAGADKLRKALPDCEVVSVPEK